MNVYVNIAEIQKNILLIGMVSHIFGICVYYVIKKYGIIIKFAVCMEEENHIKYVLIVVFPFMKKELKQVKFIDLQSVKSAFEI